MAGNPSQKMKLLMLSDILAQKTDEDHPLTAEELVAELGQRGVLCERKSVYKDIQVLCDYGMDILKSRSTKSGFYLVSRRWQVAEVRLLMDAVLAAGFITAKKSRELTGKLKSMVSVYQAQDIDRQVYIDNRKKQKNEEIYYNIDKIQAAIAAGRKIRCRYERRRLDEQGNIVANVKNFLISPYALLWQDDRYYCIGNYGKYDNLMHLRLDRMRTVEVSEDPVRSFEEVSDYRGSFDVADYAKKISNAYFGETETVELLCQNDHFEEIMDRFGEDITFRKRPDGRFAVRVQVAVSDGLVADLLKFGSTLEVIRPRELRVKMQETIGQMAAVYQEENEGNG